MENLSEIYALLNSKNEANVQTGLTVWSGIDKAAHDTFVAEWQAWADVNGISLAQYLAEHGLFVAYCADLNLTAIPAIPSGTESLRCSHNQITALPALPASLVELYCSDNQLTAKPTVPDGCYLYYGEYKFWAYNSANYFTKEHK